MRAAATLAAIGVAAALTFAVTTGAAQSAPPATESGLRLFLQAHFADARRSAPTTRYAVGWADLNGDRRPEALVYLFDGDEHHWCGTGGCPLHIFEGVRRSWRTVGSMTITRPPIRTLNSRTRGWRDISVFVAGGGIIPGYHALIPLDGRSYASNPSVPPARELRSSAPGRVLIARNDRGRRLF